MNYLVGNVLFCQFYLVSTETDQTNELLNINNQPEELLSKGGVCLDGITYFYGMGDITTAEFKDGYSIDFNISIDEFCKIYKEYLKSNYPLIKSN